jgi:hypothetical protein
MRRPAEMQLPQVGAVPFRVVVRSWGPFSTHVCSPFAPRRAPRPRQAIGEPLICGAVALHATRRCLVWVAHEYRPAWVEFSARTSFHAAVVASSGRLKLSGSLRLCTALNSSSRGWRRSSKNLLGRTEEARPNGSSGEAQGLSTSLSKAAPKLVSLDRTPRATGDRPSESRHPPSPISADGRHQTLASTETHPFLA